MLIAESCGIVEEKPIY